MKKFLLVLTSCFMVMAITASCGNKNEKKAVELANKMAEAVKTGDNSAYSQAASALQELGKSLPYDEQKRIGEILNSQFGDASTGYNDLVSKAEKVSETFSVVERIYERRVDLIPNLVETARKYIDYDGTVLDEVMEARAAALTDINLSEATPEQISAYFKTQDRVSSALSRFVALAESYPDLMVNDRFLRLYDELSGTENRIAVARRDWINAIKEYNQTVRRFPSNILASFYGFEMKEFFVATEGERIIPDIGDVFGE